MAGKAAAGKEPGFEEALKRLEAIVKDMEAGSLSLEDMIKRFEEGQTLIGLCTTRLNEVERKIEILVKKGDGVEAQPFEEGASDDDAADGDDESGPAELF